MRPALALLPAAAAAREHLGVLARAAHRLAGIRRLLGRLPLGRARVVARVDGRRTGRRLRNAVASKTLAALVLSDTCIVYTYTLGKKQKLEGLRGKYLGEIVPTFETALRADLWRATTPSLYFKLLLKGMIEPSSSTAL